MTDVYVSMNKNFQNKEDLLSKYQVNAEIMDKTKDDCVLCIVYLQKLEVKLQKMY